MTVFPSQHDRPLVGGILVRLRAASELWIERVPPVPGGHVLTATVSSQALARIPADELVSRGIRIVGRHVPPKVGRGTVDLLVPTALAEDGGAWLRQLVAEAERVFDLSHGPVRLVFADEIETHVTGRPKPG
jgi:hypothetical protein